MFSTILLAFIQSVTEFLPISSSGHLILFEKFGFSRQTLVMDVGLHLGTLVAVSLYFLKDIMGLTVGIFKAGENRKLLIRLIIATVPVLCVGVVLKEMIESSFRAILLIAGTSIFYGILLWWVDARRPAQKSLLQMTCRDAFFIGCAQVLSLVPGTSRSGITMTCARWLQFNRSDSARFSMLLSVPTIFLAAVYVLYCAIRDGKMTQELESQLMSGIFFAAFFGFLVIWFLMNWVKKSSFAVFGIYRVILGFILIGYVLY